MPYPVCIDPGPYTERLAAELSYQIGLSEKAGIGRDRLILDPGLGFGKTYEENLTVLKNLEKLNKKRAKQGLPPQKMTGNANIKTRNIDVPVNK